MQPQRSAELFEDLDLLGNPVRAFVREACEVGATLSIATQDLYDAFKTWAEKAGFTNVPDIQTFGRDLRAAIPSVDTSQHRVTGGRIRLYIGITLKRLARVGTRAGSPNSENEPESEEGKSNGEECVPSRAERDLDNTDERPELVRTYSKVLDAEFWIVPDEATLLRFKASLDPDPRPMLTAWEAAAFAQMAQEDARRLFREITQINDRLGSWLVFDRANELMGGKSAHDTLMAGKSAFDTLMAGKGWLDA